MFKFCAKVAVVLWGVFFVSSVQAHKEEEKKVLTRFLDPTTQLYGFKDQQNHIVVLPQYEFVEGSGPFFTKEFPNTEHLVPVIKKGHWWQMDHKGQLKFESVFFDNASDYYASGLARFLKDGKVGFHDRQGNVVIAPQFDFAAPFGEPDFANEPPEKFTLVCQGCWSEPEKNMKYAPISSSPTPRALCGCNHHTLVGGKWGAIDRSGQHS